MFNLCENIIVNDLQGEIVLSRRNDPQNSIILFNKIGQWIIKNITSCKTLEELVNKLASITQTNSTDISNDVRIFIDKLLSCVVLYK